MDDRSEVLREARENHLGPGPPKRLWITWRLIHRLPVDNFKGVTTRLLWCLEPGNS
jgi:hypothetical protein